MDTHIDLSQMPSLPVISRQKFAEMIGMSEGIIEGWMNRGYLPTLLIGKHRLINLALLNKLALEQEFFL
ncbi:hypothetical protein A7981_08495 [Methylovorus sp. MM2]|uniref:hypothetical protein n=1 Tax=Methylovorus sp. MM2 TaxID=1848038 RepID=UPI0007DF4095|nr:hypothetical protein [Methylovorus sp. MM2]OAM51519.1 hypothetical protein A7981_08495 [Methylovorus sp. MM2]